MPAIRKATAVVLPVLAGSLMLAACASSRSATATPSPTGTNWLLVATGSVAPSPTVSFSARAPFAAATLSPTTSRSATPAPSGSACGTTAFKGGQINGADVTAGSTSAVVKWFNPGDATLVDYHILAVSQKLVYGAQPETPGWVTVTPTGCGWMSATVTGLNPGTPYVFSVDGRWTSPGVDGTHTRTVARSGVVTTS
ncbi:fibronectin type III domain-containing protein [Actinoplanes sp. NPDC020271]|uniref:fibronectin type III domain-containing protein n=1 Tax=Actinoplanes sp. NPDC020271 TaxID=3363896 RepID=UPI0037BD7D01